MRAVLAIPITGLAVVLGGTPALAECDPDDPANFELALRCTGRLMPNCSCEGGTTGPAGPCAGAQTSDQHWACLQSRLADLEKLCAQQGNVRNEAVADAWHEVWRYANRNNWASNISLPRSCIP